MRIIQNIKALMIGSAILDIEFEKTNMPRSIFPHMNPYYYKIRKIKEYMENQTKEIINNGM